MIMRFEGFVDRLIANNDLEDIQKVDSVVSVEWILGISQNVGALHIHKLIVHTNIQITSLDQSLVSYYNHLYELDCLTGVFASLAEEGCRDCNKRHVQEK